MENDLNELEYDPDKDDNHIHTPYVDVYDLDFVIIPIYTPHQEAT